MICYGFRQCCEEVKQETHDKLDYTEKQLLMLTDDIKEKILYMTDDVQKKVSPIANKYQSVMVR